MLKQLKIAPRLALGITLLLVAAIAILLPAALRQIESVSASAETRQLDDLQRSLQARIDNTAQNALLAVHAIINAPGVAEAMANGDRARLQQLTAPVFAQIRRAHNIQQFQFHLPPARSFLRLHQPEKHGDDLSGFRASVVKTNQTRIDQVGLESGVAGLGLRAVAPVIFEGRHVGSAELGLSFGQDFFDNFTQKFGTPTALHYLAGNDVKLYASTIANQTALTADELSAVIRGESVYKRVGSSGRSWAVMARPVKDFSGAIMGVLETHIDRSDYAAIQDATLRNILLIGVGTLLLGLLVTWWFANGITRPIRELTEATEQLSRGKLDQPISGVDRGDEIGALARGVSRMSNSIQAAMDRLKKMREAAREA